MMTNRKLTKEICEGEKLVEKVTRVLEKRGAKSLNMAKEIILSEKLECKEINQAFKYYTENWNDYIHPGLISIACEAVNGNPDKLSPIQIPLLLLNAAIDIHDDIIDDSKTKYGRVTLFGNFGKDIALLVADAFLIKALTLLHKSEEQISAQKMKVIWSIIQSHFFELGDAEALEASLKGNVDVSPERCLHILEKKASGFEAHMRVGAIIGSEKQSEIDLLGNYGRALGILTFLREDFIDIFEPDEIQNRIKNECLPLPMLYAFKNQQAKNAIMDVLSKPRISNKDTERVVDIIFEEKNVKMLKNKMRRLAKKTLKNISELRNQTAKSQMQMLIKAAVEDL